MFVVYPVPEVGFIPSEKVIHKLLYENKKDYFPTHSYDVFLDRNKRVREIFRDIREHKTSAKFFDVSDNLCSKVTRRCKTFNDNRMPLYFDDDHLSSFGAQLITEEILEWMNHKNLK